MPTGVEANIFKALMDRLLALTLTPAQAIAAPNVAFPPAGQTKPKDYLEVTFLPNPTTTRTVGPGRQQHRGIMQVGHLRGYEDTKYIVAMPTAVGCSVLIDNWRNVPQTSKFLDLGAAASGNVIEVKNYVGTRFDFMMDLVQDASASQNTFILADDVMAQRTTIASDAITIRNPAVARYRLDTESAAATDNLTYIAGGTDGQVVFLTTTSDARDVVLVHNGAAPPAGHAPLFLKGAVNRTLGTINDIVAVMFSSFANKWIEI
ncbi:hypothetical protein GOE20_07080 [Sinorhizobium medicae]|nr:hypothetical protein [Sinorhizobium medicae]